MASSEWISSRNVLWILALLGRAVHDMSRSNLNIAIVAMVKHNFRHKSNITYESECFNASFTNEFVRNKTVVILPQDTEQLRYDWNEYQQGLILGGFYWLYGTSTVIGSIWIQKRGGKLIFGISNFLSCLIAALIPVCVGINYQMIVFLRVLQGFVGGLGGSTVSAMAAAWIPPNERSKFFTSYLGDSIGAAICYPLFGVMIERLGWQSVFYLTAVTGLAWSLSWYFLVFDSPAQHPRISESERMYIENALGQHIPKKKLPIPWKSIFMSCAMWMNIMASVAAIWSLVILLTQAPTYFTVIHGMIISMAGVFSGLPHVARVVFGISVSLVADFILKKELLTRAKVHKIMTSICTIGQGLFVLGVAYSGCNTTVAIVSIALALACGGTATGGYIAAAVDNAPNFASVSMGMIGFMALLPSFISPVIVGLVTYQNQTSGSWEIVFLMAAVPLIISGIIYIMFGSSDVQSWNSPPSISEKELELLSGKNDNNEEQTIKCSD